MQLPLSALDNSRQQSGHATTKTATPSVKMWSPVAPARSVAEMLNPSSRIIGLTMGQFSMIDLVGAILDRTGPAHVKLSTWTAGIRDAENAWFMLDTGKMLSFELYCDKSFPSRHPEYAAAVVRRFGDRAVNASDIHAKVATIRNPGWNVTVRGSMNLNRNPRCENYDIDDDQGIADFFDAHFAIMRSAGVPLGLGKVSNAQVDMVFERIARGVNPFSVQTRTQLAAAGVPFGSAFRPWTMARMRSKQGAPRTLAAAARKLGLDTMALSRAVDAGEGDACVELASMLV